MSNADNNHAAGVVVFDLDGTLTDTSGDIVYTVNFMRSRMGLSDLSKDEVLAAVGRGAPFLLRALLDIEAYKKETFEQLLKVFEEHYLAHQGERSHLYPGIREALTVLEKKYDLYVLSNKPQRSTTSEVQKMGIADHFKAVWGAGAMPALKPDPAGIETAVALSGVSKSKAVMAGDLRVDMEAGRRAGVRTCFVTWGFGSLPGEELRPDAVVSSAFDLEAAIDRLLQ
jgi:phosphoglycolate phosphatase